MSDRYAQLVNAPVASTLARQLGLPRPARLERRREGGPLARRASCSPARRPAAGSSGR